MNNKLVDMTKEGPIFLEEYWENAKLKFAPPSYYHNSLSQESLVNDKTLIDSIKRAHKHLNNAQTKNKHIIVTSGVPNALQLLGQVLNKSLKLYVPYEKKYPMIIRGPRSESPISGEVGIISYPNIVNNTLYSNEVTTHIYDCSLYAPMFTQESQLTLLDKDIMIFSASGLLGACSSQIAWIILSDVVLYNSINAVIEKNQSHPSLDAQRKVGHMLDYVTGAAGKDFFEVNTEIMQIRWNTLKSKKLPFKIFNTFGLYALCQGICPPSIKCIHGSYYGLTNDYFTLNIGCSDNDFELFLSKF